MENPFKLTRAADLDDEQILRLWVDPHNELENRLRASSQLPMIILGGKGSGKTHLMRYHSYGIQERLHGRALMPGIVKRSGYIGIYGRCSGLNADRFTRKGFSDEQWHALFSFYVELWLGQLLLNTLLGYLEHDEIRGTFEEQALVAKLVELMDKVPRPAPSTLRDFAAFLRGVQKEFDLAVNNASFGPVVMPQITVSSGALIFGIPAVIASDVPSLKATVFTLLIDEYEHLPERAQRYVNTLVRERVNPVTFKIGARLYGFKTFSTFSGDEELREGSEYELLNLDEALREKEDAYEDFALNLCVSRIRFAFGKLPDGWTDETAPQQFEACFEQAEPAEERVRKKLDQRGASPWLTKLLKSLESHVGLSVTELQRIGSQLANDDPLIEKTNTFLLYRAWSRRVELQSAAEAIRRSAKRFAKERAKDTDHWRVLDKFRDDLRAQMIDEVELPHLYTGLRTWIRMSDGIPRNLITTLKHVYDWASFHQEDVLRRGGISLRSQMKGVQLASEWFVNDARVLGRDEITVKSGLNRVSSLMRSLRYSAKPPECSLCTFEIDSEASRAEFTRILRISEHWSLLIRVRDRLERNTTANVLRYRLSGMIAPKYDLPLYTRGSIHLSSEEAATIFGGAPETEFAKTMRAREARANPPFKAVSAGDIDADELRLF